MNDPSRLRQPSLAGRATFDSLYARAVHCCAALREIFDESAYARFLSRSTNDIVSRSLRRVLPGIRSGQGAPAAVLLRNSVISVLVTSSQR